MALLLLSFKVASVKIIVFKAHRYPFYCATIMPAAILSVILANFAFVCFVLWFDVSRPWVNIDYVLILVLYVAGLRWMVGLLLMVVLLVDVLVIAAQVFPFPRLTDLFYLLGFSLKSSAFHLSMLIGVVILVAATAVAFIAAARSASLKSSLILLNGLLVIQLYSLYGADEGETRNTYRKLSDLPVASQTANFIDMRSHQFLTFFDNKDAVLQSRDPGATAPWFAALENKSLPLGLLLIVNESWGVPVNQDVQEAILAPIMSIPARTLELGELSFNGVTLSGELRELCALHSSSYNLVSLQEGLEPCLAYRLRALGYETGAMHGATGMMYDRRHWYPLAGFQHTIFFEDKVWPRRCFSFPGACDQDMLEYVVKFFSVPGSRFFYWLTLNSHAKYDSRDIDRYLLDCKAFDISPDSESCRNILLQAQFFAGLARILREDVMQGVEVIVVGDHAPVIMNLEERKRVFSDNTVPWLRFRSVDI